ncbi:hypothetical protein [Nonomuraea typhae]|uniref:hypothetical protein n=1 Tax=Nonomuraea typhae TaxID=2603600 RepID=UPI0012F9C6F1|nr:hypothetical protein [Nonomuraea typhae]
MDIREYYPDMATRWTVRHVFAQKVPFEGTFVVTFIEGEKGTGRRLYFDGKVGAEAEDAQSYLIATEAGQAVARPIKSISFDGSILSITLDDASAWQLGIDAKVSLDFEPTSLAAEARHGLEEFFSYISVPEVIVNL